jgi:hypothetical protein
MSGAPNRRQRRAARAFIALALAVACLGGVAYAATGLDRSRPVSKQSGSRGPGPSAGEGPPRPRFIETPASVGVDPDSRFRFHVAPAQTATAGSEPSRPTRPTPKWRQFECRLDGSEWSDCSSPHVLVGLDPGTHAFAVRALNRRERFGQAAHYRWTQLEPMGFSVDPLFGSLPELMPGDPSQQLPVRISNPNPAPIDVTDLTVLVVPDRPGCAADPNFTVTPSSLTPENPLRIPAGGSVSLPTATATAPTLALRELPVDQNACPGASLHLGFSGQARG